MARLLPAPRFFIQARNFASSTKFLQGSSLQWHTKRPDHHFSVNSANGFMPRSSPLRHLPDTFSSLDSLLKRMSIVQPNGSPGLLATGDLGRAVHAELLPIDVSGITDPALTSALFRDYSMLASAYMLEPSHLGMDDTGAYAPARGVLPAQIAKPLMQLALKLEYFPFMDYAQSYALNNWSLKDPNAPITLDNLSMFRRFHGGEDENGFVMVHVAMVSQSHKQVQAAQEAISAASQRNHGALAHALNNHAEFLSDIYEIFVKMWSASSPKAYLAFRTFIMGHTGNDSIFPNGVVYEGVSDEPMRFRGETGAQDSIIPASDNLLQLKYPRNTLSDYLVDLRQYRPRDAQEYLEWILHAAQQAKVEEVALETPFTALARLRNLNMVQKIRSQHWSMTKQYIINNTKHPKATGGTPITTWLPNNLGMTLSHMMTTSAKIETLQANHPTLSASDEAEFHHIRNEFEKKIEKLREEVQALQQDFQDQEPEEFDKCASST